MNHHLLYFRSAHRAVLIEQNKGIILPLVAMMVSLLIILAAITIDLSIAENSREQATNHAKLACLAALDAHFNSPSSNTTTQKIAAALQRAQDVGITNIILSDKNKVNPLNYSPTLADASDNSGQAKLTAGQWFNDYIRRDGLGTSLGQSVINPCPNTQTQTPGCFRPHSAPVIAVPNSTPPAESPVNAYQIEGNYYQSITLKLGSFLGITSLPAVVKVTCTAIPRELAFLVDITPSMKTTNHISRTLTDMQSTPTQGRGSQFSYFLQSDNASIISGLLPSGDDDEWTWFTGSTAWRRASPNTSPYSHSNTTDQEYDRMHYPDDYSKVTTLCDQQFPTTEPSDKSSIQYKIWKNHPNPRNNDGTKNLYSVPYCLWYRVDTFRDQNYNGSDPKYPGPMPLGLAFTGINQAISMFRSRAVGGDKASIIFYDSSLLWPRIVLPTDDWDYLQSLVDFSLPTKLPDDPAGITNAEILSTTPQGITPIRHILFPNRSIVGGRPTAPGTNTYAALNEAYKMLQNGMEPGIPAQLGIVLFGDGEANCDPNAAPTSPSCSDTRGYYDMAQQAIKDHLNDSGATVKNIPTHVFLMGDSIAPHTLEYADPNDHSKCLSDSAARNGNYAFVDGANSGTFPGSGSSPFYQSNVDAYSIATATQGLWAPIRPSPAGCTISPCLGSPPVPPSTPTRRTTDPSCRTPQLQVQDGIRQIINQNPYVVVGVE